MIEIKDKSLCCGCRACENICPKNCITMINDESGFIFPNVDKNRCINCNLCDSVCPIINNDLNEIKYGYVSYSKNINREKGSSGGMFPELAEYIIKTDGIVYGAYFDKNLKLKCKGINELNNISLLTKSKYLQCDMENKYKEIFENLESGKIVLFVSTPCYCQALKNYLKKDYDNLYLVDFVCHGVPNQKLFDKNIEWYKKSNFEIKKYDFRDNEHNINCSRVFKIESDKKVKKGTFMEDPYYYYYCCYYISLRESCYNCNFAVSKRCSDITIGDFHNPKILGMEKERLKGFSSLLINTEKGKRLFENIKDNLKLINLPLETIIKSNGALLVPTPKPSNTENFRKDFGRLSYEELMKKYGFYSIKTRLKRNYYKLPNVIQNVIRKILIKGEI